jgi:Flp pilus assembly pilin Flp
MKRAIIDILIRIYRDESAVTTVEYALIAALMAAAAIVAATQLGQAETDALNRGKTYFESGQ